MSPDAGTAERFAQGCDVASMTRIDTDGSRRADPRHSLLLLEDDQALRQMLAWELSELGFRVLAVGTCREARAAVTAEDFDLALFDIGLPDGDGAELAAELIELNPSVRIALCSGRPEAPTRERLPSNVVACLTKPISIPGLVALFRGSN